MSGEFNMLWKKQVAAHLKASFLWGLLKTLNNLRKILDVRTDHFMNVR
jgi:hypothetical protein